MTDLTVSPSMVKHRITVALMFSEGTGNLTGRQVRNLVERIYDGINTDAADGTFPAVDPWREQP